MIPLLALALLSPQAAAPAQTAPIPQAESDMPPLKVKVGDLAPDFTVEAVNGKPLRLSGFRGKAVVLDFWASWCGPCEIAMPVIQKAVGPKARDVVVLAVDVWDDRKPFDKWIKANAGKQPSFTFAYDRKGNDKKERQDKRDSSVAKRLYGVWGIPTTLVIDKKGRIAEIVIALHPEENGRFVAALNRVRGKTAD